MRNIHTNPMKKSMITKATANMEEKALPTNVKPLDGGWGWLVVVGMGLSFATFAGYQKSYTMIYENMLVRFGDTAFNTAMPAAVFQGFLFFMGPLGGLLCNKYGHRKVTIIGGFCTGLGLCISAFVPSMTIMCLSYGLLAGSGAGIIMTAVLAMVGLYFDKKRGIAVSIGTTTTGIGGIIYAPLVAWLLKMYGFPGTMLVCGAIFFNLIVAGALFRPLQDNYPKYSRYKAASDVYLLPEKGDIKALTPEKVAHQNKRLLSSSLANLQIDPMGSCPNIHESPADTGSNPDGLSNNQQKSQTWVTNLVQGLGLNLCTDITFCLFCMQLISMNWLFYTIALFLSGFASENGVSARMTTVLIILFNVGDLGFRIPAGLIFDLKPVKQRILTIHSLLGVVTYVGIIVFSLCRNVYLMCIIIVISSAGLAGFHAQHVNAVVDIVTPQRLTSAVGILRFVSGIGSILSPLIGGYIKDVTGVYWPSYTLAGCLGLFTNTVFLLTHNIKNLYKRREHSHLSENEKTTSQTDA